MDIIDILPSVEIKYYDTSLVSSVLTAPTDASGGEHDPSATSMISTPVRGDGDQDRDGKQILCQYLEFNAVIKVSSVASGPLESILVYLAIVLDTQTNKTQINSEDVYKNISGSAVMAANPLRNLIFGSRFEILQSEIYNLTTESINGTAQAIKWFIPLNNLEINFNEVATATIANVIDNSLHVIAYTDNTTPQSTLSYNARLRFVG